jgi:hypothetical protein
LQGPPKIIQFSIFGLKMYVPSGNPGPEQRCAVGCGVAHFLLPNDSIFAVTAKKSLLVEG